MDTLQAIARAQWKIEANNVEIVMVSAADI